MGIAIVAVELGVLLAYRAGWRMSVASLTVNSALALVLVPVGVTRSIARGFAGERRAASFVPRRLVLVASK